jgi:hypothetical protein
MPFTPSHIAAALPFVRTPLPIAPLVIGTMAPDVPYYAAPDIPRDLTHSLPGVPTVDLAISVVLTLLWFAALRAPIVDLLPRAIRERIPAASPLGWRAPGRSWGSAVLLGIAAALVGILTHLAWDAFTHPGWLVDALPVFESRIGPLTLVAWLQHSSTVAGLGILAVWCVMWFRRTRPDAPGVSVATPTGRVAAWVAVLVAFGGTGLAMWLGFIALGLPPFDPSPVFLSVTVAGAVAGLTALIVCAIWWVVRSRRARVRPT